MQYLTMKISILLEIGLGIDDCHKSIGPTVPCYLNMTVGWSLFVPSGVTLEVFQIWRLLHSMYLHRPMEHSNIGNRAASDNSSCHEAAQRYYCFTRLSHKAYFGKLLLPLVELN